MSEQETKQDTVKVPEVTIWQWFTEMAETEHERGSYYMILRHEGKELKFILRASADGTLVAEPYNEREYDYDYNYDDDEDDEYDDEED